MIEKNVESFHGNMFGPYDEYFPIVRRFGKKNLTKLYARFEFKCLINQIRKM